MYVIPVNPNAIEISTIQTGCCQSEFDPTYPAHLNGIIRPDEFQYSMQMINQTISSRTSRILVGLIAALMVIGGIALFIAGGSSNGSSHSGGFPPLVGGGLALLFGGIIFLIFGQLVVENHRNKRMRQAIARESAKYSMRSPTPCSWRLHSTRTWSGGYRNRRSAIFYRLIIEIGHPIAPVSGNIPYQFNQVPTQVTSYYLQPNHMPPPPPNNMPPPSPNNMPPPPPYSSVAPRGFCSQCGMPRQNPTAKFCSSCGQTFNF